MPAQAPQFVPPPGPPPAAPQLVPPTLPPQGGSAGVTRNSENLGNPGLQFPVAPGNLQSLIRATQIGQFVWPPMASQVVSGTRPGPPRPVQIPTCFQQAPHRGHRLPPRSTATARASASTGGCQSVTTELGRNSAATPGERSGTTSRAPSSRPQSILLSGLRPFQSFWDAPSATVSPEGGISCTSEHAHPQRSTSRDTSEQAHHHAITVILRGPRIPSPPNNA